MKQKTIIWILVLLLFIQLVTATGIRPAKTELAFDETKTYQGTIWVVNNDHREFSVHISVEGEMAQYVTINTEELSFRADDDAKPIGFSVNLPETVPPGTSTANIIIEEILTSTSSNTVSAKIVLKHKISIDGPYPDKYIKAKLEFVNQGEQISFVSEVENLGKKDINQLQTKFYVNDKQQQEHTLETETIALARKENRLLKTTMDKNVFEQGEFEVSAIITYDDHQTELIKNMVVGEPTIEITYFDKYFIAHKINQYSMDLLNKWNKEVKNVFVDVEVKKDDEKIDEFRTKSVDIAGEMAKRINDYLDAEDKGPGTYTFDMIVNFWNLVRNEQEPFSFESEFVTEDDAKSLDLAKPIVGQALATDKDGEEISFYGVLFWMLFGIIIGAIGFYIFWRYTHRNQYEDGDEGAL